MANKSKTPLPRLVEVAARAGVSVSTASAALNGLALVRAATRLRVEQAARELGYRKDASAAVLATRRHRSRTKPGRLSLGYLISPTATHRRSEAFAQRAAALGYDTEWVDLREFAGPEAASRALWHRNVAGLFYASPNAVPGDGNWVAGFDWGRFSVVKFTRARPELRFDLVRHSAFDYASRTVREVVARGYRRIGVLLGGSAVPEDDEARLGAVLGWRALRQPRGVHLDWTVIQSELKGNRQAALAVRAWVGRLKPEVVIGFPDGIYWGLREERWRIPEDFAFASIAVKDEGSEVAGCLAQHEEVVVKAVEMLDRQIRSGVRGMVVTPQETVIEPVWLDGPSLPVRVPVGRKG